ncbi:hypothetical protein MNQ95_02290 [Pseudoxanthomonas daejeonensis]|uniref:hypothetical protein n=1 Tax=Pseudoxanthomonas daejeonensis TaxID=266062 RepID=UPI001F546F23|nr:hypothetical protein [Pseudoxanthomonas daejeonensis]UNK57962.1 hypothetical protein MNQ95_02290 [Pseudoxanthomonas daejeonensis]
MTGGVTGGLRMHHYTPAGQQVFAKNYLRPMDDAVLRRHAASFLELETFRVESAFGSWLEAQKKHFADGGVSDRTYSKR